MLPFGDSRGASLMPGLVCVLIEIDDTHSVFILFGWLLVSIGL